MNSHSQRKFALLTSAVLLAGAPTLRADTPLQLPDIKDAMIFGKKPTGMANPTPAQYVDTGNASGLGPAMFAGADGSGNIKRSLIQFDTSAVPSNAIITSATVTLYLAQIAGSGNNGVQTLDRQFGLYALQQAWTEGPSNAQTQSGVGGTGQGSTAGNGDTTWDYASFNSNATAASFWGSPSNIIHGGNFSSTESDMLDVSSGSTLTLNQAITFASSSGLIADVQSWVDGASANDGWLLKSDNLELTATSFLGFWTKDSLALNSTDGAQAPVLSITYVLPVPEPATLMVFAGAALLLLLPQRKSRLTS